jgi:hypothetical protein
MFQSSGDLLNGSEDDDDDEDDDDEDDDDEDDDEGDYEDSVMEVQPDIIVGGEEDNNQNQVNQRIPVSEAVLWIRIRKNP